ncbi:transposase [Iodobacter ciconiae]|uniref:Transposase n=1 Tax=Iodobacter ciconiae TaxID=2496266 RepID=A0A3S8ZRH3_9NEIS|nr:transposase [Iodobacter ciconiae]AZN36086.1 transposase [Iodobacter ciconiae]
MKPAEYSDSQIMAILKQAEEGFPVAALCRQYGMSSACFCKWRTKFYGVGAFAMARIKELEDENRHLRKMYLEARMRAELMRKAMLKKRVKSSWRRQMAHWAVEHYLVSVREACACFAISLTCYHYVSRLEQENKEIADCLRNLTETNPEWGFGLCFLYLRNVQQRSWNHKRVYRIYCDLALNQRMTARA